MRGAAASTRAVERGDGLVGSTFSGGFSSGSVTSVVVSCGGGGCVDLGLLLLLDFRHGQLDGDGRGLIAELFIRLRLPQQITADQRDVQANHNGGSDRPAE